MSESTPHNPDSAPDIHDSAPASSESAPGTNEFDVLSAEAEAWMTANSADIRRWALGAFYQRLDVGIRVANRDRIEAETEDIGQIITMRFLRRADFRERAQENRAFLAVSVRNEVTSWLRGHGRELLPPERPRDPNDEYGDGFESERADELGPTPEDEVIDAPEDARRARGLRALADVFDDASVMLAELDHLAQDNHLLRSRLDDSRRMRPILDRLLGREQHAMFCLLMRDGRDDYEGATEEALDLARAFLEADGAWQRLAHDPKQRAEALAREVRIVQNRRSDWIRSLRELFADRIAAVRLWLREELLPDIRPVS